MEKRIDYPETGAFLEYTPLPGAKGLVLVCPGGGYEFVSPREGAPIARAFAKAGWQAFVLTYSTGSAPLGTRPLTEVAWAARTIRDEAETLGMGKAKLVVCGFSAGAHLAASLGVHWDDAELFPDGAMRERQKPDAMILSYPVITDGAFRHAGSFQKLAGDGGATGYFSLEKHVSEKTPPAFLWHTATDHSVPVQNSFLFADALLRHGQAVEMHIYPFGKHGLSLATKEVEDAGEGRFADAHVAGWFGLCTEWLDVIFA